MRSPRESTYHGDCAGPTHSEPVELNVSECHERSYSQLRADEVYEPSIQVVWVLPEVGNKSTEHDKVTGATHLDLTKTERRGSLPAVLPDICANSTCMRVMIQVEIMYPRSALAVLLLCSAAWKILAGEAPPLGLPEIRPNSKQRRDRTTDIHTTKGNLSHNNNRYHTEEPGDERVHQCPRADGIQ